MPLNSPSPLSLWSAPRRKVERPTLTNPFYAKNSCLDRGSITVFTSSRALDQFSHILITMSASNWVLWNRILSQPTGQAGIDVQLCAKQMFQGEGKGETGAQRIGRKRLQGCHYSIVFSVRSDSESNGIKSLSDTTPALVEISTTLIWISASLK